MRLARVPLAPSSGPAPSRRVTAGAGPGPTRTLGMPSPRLPVLSLQWGPLAGRGPGVREEGKAQGPGGEADRGSHPPWLLLIPRPSPVDDNWTQAAHPRQTGRASGSLPPPGTCFPPRLCLLACKAWPSPGLPPGASFGLVLLRGVSCLAARSSALPFLSASALRVPCWAW